MEKRRVVFYGRVSTQSDEQLSAFDNQMVWYNQLLALHPEWTVVGEYEDAGVTGTSVRKRKGFQQMLDDGIKFHKYDLIVTRETKRFARNTVDALSYVRLLKQHGIEIYFVNDGIWTISDNDGELRLSIMATIAQEESRKTSENVRAGQRISRQKGVLRGTGNILGYRRVGRNQYEIDTEQAIIVKKIFKWYLSGDGIRTIKRKLEEHGYKTATGKSKWQFQVIDDILKNPFYTGRQRQLGKISDGYLTQNRVKNSPDQVEYIQGDYEPIISKEAFEEVERLREQRYNKMNSKGKKESRSVWCGKYLCGCGCGTVRRIASGNEYIFICHSQHTQGIKKKSMGGETVDSCSLRTILEWKLDMIAWHVINDVWGSSKTDMSQALKIIEECYREETTLSQLEISAIKDKIEKLERRKRGLLDMRADGEITKEEYAVKRNEYETQINKLNVSIAEVETSQIASADYNKKISSMKQALEKILDLSQPKLNRDIVDGFVWRLVHISDNEFDIYLSMGNDSFGDVGSEEKVIKYKVFESSNPKREERVKCTKLKSIRLTYDDAVRYRTMSGKRVLKHKWEDLEVNIYI
ncbi:resolvase [Clostridium sp. MCC353]|uniref:recombinase family protein n=1 Tax=Clostridium sp. MCC353 TaxID=2592646 RepID=UPI001C011743|nr:recombinase family protein [Clostridium sp. MCC353]MBT9775915.1 resolvase [Clostridium sp. MCC353]